MGLEGGISGGLLGDRWDGGSLGRGIGSLERFTEVSAQDTTTWSSARCPTCWAGELVIGWPAHGVSLGECVSLGQSSEVWEREGGQQCRCMHRLFVIYLCPLHLIPEASTIIAALELVMSTFPCACLFASSLLINSIRSLSNPFHPISSPFCHSFFSSFW